jgi:hypothetical protein
MPGLLVRMFALSSHRSPQHTVLNEIQYDVYRTLRDVHRTENKGRGLASEGRSGTWHKGRRRQEATVECSEGLCLATFPAGSPGLDILVCEMKQLVSTSPSRDQEER